MVGVVVGLLARAEPAVGVTAIFNEDDRRVGAGLAEQLDEGPGAGGGGGAIEIRAAVDDVRGGVDLGEQLAHFRLHPAVATEAEIHDRPAVAAMKDRRVAGARARGARPMRDRRAIEHDRLVAAAKRRGSALERRAGGDADLE